MLRIATVLVSFLLALGVAACGDDDDGGASPTSPPAGTPEATATSSAPTAGSLTLTSSAFADGGAIPTQYTCEGAGISPPLTVGGVPADAQGLALIMIDTSIGDFVHWTVWNFVPGTTEIAEGTVPQGGVEGATGRAEPGYIGPCPAAGTATHDYVFTLYALDGELTLDAGADEDALLEAMHGHILNQVSLTGTYTLSSRVGTPQ
jgi:hypothetical protein